MATTAQIAIAPTDELSTDELATHELLAVLHRTMVVTRWVDDRLGAMRREGRIPPHVGSRGEEAAIVGAAAALRAQDWIFPASPELGAALWRGLPLETYAHHLFASAIDGSKGRQPPERFSSRTLKIASPSGAAGAHLAHAVGFAWAAKIRRDDVVALAFLNEATTSSTDFHSALNFAGVYKIPVVFVCRTGPSGGVPVRDAAGAWVARQGSAYGVPGVSIDGGDVLAVRTAVADAIANAASGGGATLVDARLADASDGAHDPIARARRVLEARGLWSDAKQADLERHIDTELMLAVAAAEGAAPPPASSLFDDVYAELPWHLREQRAQLRTKPTAKESE